VDQLPVLVAQKSATTLRNAAKLLYVLTANKLILRSLVLVPPGKQKKKFKLLSNKIM
jgi:hypothetical protein